MAHNNQSTVLLLLHPVLNLHRLNCVLDSSAMATIPALTNDKSNKENSLNSDNIPTVSTQPEGNHVHYSQPRQHHNDHAANPEILALHRVPREGPKLCGTAPMMYSSSKHFLLNVLKGINQTQDSSLLCMLCRREHWLEMKVQQWYSQDTNVMQ